MGQRGLDVVEGVRYGLSIDADLDRVVDHDFGRVAAVIIENVGGTTVMNGDGASGVGFEVRR